MRVGSILYYVIGILFLATILVLLVDFVSSMSSLIEYLYATKTTARIHKFVRKDEKKKEWTYQVIFYVGDNSYSGDHVSNVELGKSTHNVSIRYCLGNDNNMKVINFNIVKQTLQLLIALVLAVILTWRLICIYYPIL